MHRSLRALMFSLIGCATAACGEKAFTTADASASDDDAATRDSDGGVPDASEAGAIEGGVRDASPRGGSDASAFPTFDKGCSLLGGAGDCVVVFHRVDCCGTKRAIGINKTQASNFGATEALWDNTCPLCGCDPGATVADDGSQGPSVSVSCSSQQCVSHAQ